MDTDVAQSWRNCFRQWPSDLDRRGVLVTSFGEQIVFDAFATSDDMLLLERKAPDTVGPFLEYCRTDFTGCASKIAEGELEQTMDDLTNKTNKACVIPTGVIRKQGVADIVNWLAKHPETASMSVLNGAKAAAKGLWNCETKVKTGITPGVVSDTTGR